MTLVFPVSHVDLHLALPLAQWMKKLGPYPRHDALIVWSSELTPEQREPIAVEFREMGWSSPPKAFTAQVTRQSWPEAPNEIFRQAAQLIETDAQFRRVWYFFELDNVPTRKGWLDELADEFNSDLSRPFLGYVDTTWEQDNQTAELRKIGTHLVGTGIYPPNLSFYTQAHLTCLNAFDLAMSRDIARIARHTNLIHNNWRSVNYRWTHKDGQWILSSDVSGLRAQQFGHAINRDVLPGPAVIHGCKDLSLIDAIKAGQPKPKVVRSKRNAGVFTPKKRKFRRYVMKKRKILKKFRDRIIQKHVHDY
jgi:hypothetical protein